MALWWWKLVPTSNDGSSIYQVSTPSVLTFAILLLLRNAAVCPSCFFPPFGILGVFVRNLHLTNEQQCQKSVGLHPIWRICPRNFAGRGQTAYSTLPVDSSGSPSATGRNISRVWDQSGHAGPCRTGSPAESGSGETGPAWLESTPLCCQVGEQPEEEDELPGWLPWLCLVLLLPRLAQGMNCSSASLSRSPDFSGPVHQSATERESAAE